MESIINDSQGKAGGQAIETLLNSWETLLQALPKDYAVSAVHYKALQRRRGIRNAEDLLHLALGYSVLDKSLNELGCWAMQQGVADISAPAIYERLKDAHRWIGRILFQFLEQRRLRLPKGQDVNVDIRDATVVCRPGSKGTDWRIHLSLDLGAMIIQGAELTDAKGGESLVRFAGAANRIVLADRIHATRNGLISLLQAGGRFAIRMTWQNLPLKDAQQQDWRVIDWLQNAFSDPKTVFQEHEANLYTTEQNYALRVCAVRLAKEAADLAVRRARKQVKKNGHTPDARTLFAAQFVLVVTNLAPELWSTEQVLDLYRVRWQIELFFKRLKSILFLDHLRAKKTDLAQTYLLTKLLAACLLDCLVHRFVQALPLGFATNTHPLSYWTLVSLLWGHFQNLIRGPLSLDHFFDNPEKSQRFLCNPPRKRKQQLASVRLRLISIPGSSQHSLLNGLS